MDNNAFHKSETITFCAACFSAAAVVVAIILSIYFSSVHSNQLYYASSVHSNQLYYATMQQCIEARGTWVPSNNTGACVISNNNFQ